MNELIQLVSQKAGLSEDKAKTAVDTVIGFLKQKLPAPIAGQIDSAIGGGSQEGSLAGAAKGIGDVFGGKK